MGKAVRLTGMGLLVAAALLAAGAAGAQVNGAPAMPKAVTPQLASSYVPVASQASDVDAEAKHKNTLRAITQKKAELDLLKAEAEVANFKKPQEEAAKKEEVAGLQAALEQAKRERAVTPPVASASVRVVDMGPPVLLLATFGSPDTPRSGYAEFKVGDLMVSAKVGERLPSGHYLKAVHFDSVELSKSKAARNGKVIYISPLDTASVYGSRAKSGAAVEPAPAAAGQPMGGAGSFNGLPPMPANR